MQATVIDERTLTAYHEAAHACVGIGLGKIVDSITIVREGDCTGVVHWAGDEPQPTRHSTLTEPEPLHPSHRKAIIALAGAMAEHKLTGQPITGGDRYSPSNTDWAGYLAEVERRNAINPHRDHGKDLRHDADFHVCMHWREIEIVAQALLTHDTLTGAEVYELIGKPVPAGLGGATSSGRASVEVLRLRQAQRKREAGQLATENPAAAADQPAADPPAAKLDPATLLAIRNVATPRRRELGPPAAATSPGAIEQRVRALNGSLWLCEPVQAQALAMKVAGFGACFSGRQLAQSRRDGLEFAAAAASHMVYRPSGKPAIGFVPVFGPLDQRMTTELLKSGGTACDEISVSLNAMLADRTIGNIVFMVDSPGGSVFGIQELADEIFAARKSGKKIYAIADSMAASAAYWIASAAETVICTPGGMVGSVGVYCMHADVSKAMDNEGVKVSFIHAAKYKVEGNPYEPLSDEGRENWQGRVDEIYGRFVSALARNRDVATSKVRSSFGEGRVVSAHDAKKRGMVDRVQDFGGLMASLLS